MGPFTARVVEATGGKFIIVGVRRDAAGGVRFADPLALGWRQRRECMTARALAKCATVTTNGPGVVLQVRPGMAAVAQHRGLLLPEQAHQRLHLPVHADRFVRASL